MKRLLFLVLLIPLPIPSAFPQNLFQTNGIRVPPPPSFTGRLAVYDDGDCNHLNIFFHGPADCQAFNRRFDLATGAALSANDPLQGYDPLGIVLEASYRFSALPSYDCPTVEATSNLDGYFQVTPKACQLPFAVGPDPPQGSPPPDQLRIRLKLIYPVYGRAVSRDSSSLNFRTTVPIIRGLWRKDQIDPHYPGHSDPVFATVSEGGQELKYAIPTFDKVIALGGSISLGTLVFPDPDTSPPAISSYLRKVLLNWRTMVEYHERLKNILVGLGKESWYFDKFFITDPPLFGYQSYTLLFHSAYASFGKNGFMVLSAPKANLEFTSDNMPHIIGHELGHSIQFALAGDPFPNLQPTGQWRFANIWMRPDGSEYTDFHDHSEILGMTTAFVEGLATALGNYLFNGCGSDWADNGGIYPDPYPVPHKWRPDPTCDGSDYCTYHSFRWHMVLRGIAEGSPEWNTRLARLQELADTVKEPNRITSNNEARYAFFICDLVNKSSDIQHSSEGKRADHPYFDNFLFQVGKVMNGEPPQIEPNYRKYTADVLPKTFHINLVQLIEALQGFCPTCNQSWLPETMDPKYPEIFLSAHGPIAPQALGQFMIGKGWFSQEQLNNVLRANFMEEYLYQPDISEIFPRPEIVLQPPSRGDSYLSDLILTTHEARGDLSLTR